MEEHPPSQFQFLGSLRRMGGTFAATLHNRLELFSTELEEEKAWLISTLIWAAVAVFFSGLAVLLTVGAIVYLTPESARPWVLSGFALLFIFIAVNAITGLLRSLRDKPPPLADTLGELRKDIEWIRSRE